MPLATQGSPISKGLWAGSIVSALVALMLLADSVSKMMKAAPVLKAQAELGFPDSLTVGIGVVLFICTLVYVIPRTSILGAILLTGYLRRRCRSQTAHRRFTLRPGPVSRLRRRDALGWTLPA